AIELEASSDDVPLTAADLSPPVPEAQSPVREDAIELDGLSLDTAAIDVLPAPSAPVSHGLELDLGLATTAPATAPATELELDLGGELELEPPAMAAMPSPPATPVPEPEPATAPTHPTPDDAPRVPPPIAPSVAPAAVADTMPLPPRTSPAPVPETEQTIKWVRAPALAPLVGSSPPAPAKNPFSSGDSNLSNPFAPKPLTSTPAREETQRFTPNPARTTTPPREETQRFTPNPARTTTPAREVTQRFTPAPGPAPDAMRAEIDQTRPWSRAALVEGLPRTASPQPPRLRTPPLETPMPGAELPPLARAPMPRIASMDVPGSVSPPAIEQTQRWPTAKVRVADAPLEMPVGEVPFSQPPELAEQGGLEGGLDALFPSDGSVAGADEPAFAEPMLDPRLEVRPALDVTIELDESFEPAPEPAPVPPSAPIGFRGGDDTLPLPAAPGIANPFQLKGDTAPLPPAADDFGPSGGLLGDDDDLGVGGNAGDLFGGVEITDPGTERRVPATAEDGFEAPDDIGPTLDTHEPLELTAVDDAEPVDMVEVSDLDEYEDVLGEPTPAAPSSAATSSAAPSSAAPSSAAATSAPPLFDEVDAEPVVTAEISAETQERLLHAAMVKPPEAAPAAPGPVRTDPLFSRPAAPTPEASRPEPKPTETQPYFTLGSLGLSLPPLPPPPPAMTRAPPLPSRAGTPPLSVNPAAQVAPEPTPGPALARAAEPTSPTPVSPTPQRTDPFFPSWPGEAGRPASPHDPFAGLSARAPAAAAAPLLGNTVVNPPTQEPLPDLSGDSFFDDMAFQVADQAQATLPTPADQWQVQQSSGEAAPSASADDDIPVVMGRTATPSTANPWTVGEPAKTG
ncbi:MAG: hypothetical protein IT382_23555, partial [Deltaproteobacteria bacterium]|nr:hypothetical protein [Deltaproteobacteria bacterium]